MVAFQEWIIIGVIVALAVWGIQILIPIEGTGPHNPEIVRTKFHKPEFVEGIKN